MGVSAPVSNRRITWLAFLMDFGIGIVMLALPLLVMYRGGSAFQMGMIGLLHRLPCVLGCAVFGPFSDRIGRRRSILISCICLIVLYLFMGFCTSLVLTFFLVGGIGFANALFWPAVQAWMGDLYQGDTNQIIVTVGRYNLKWSVGQLLGNLLAGSLLRVGLGIPFVVSGVFAVMIALLAKNLPEVQVAELAQEEEDLRKDKDQKILHYVGYAQLANFCAWLALGMIVSIFPRIAAQRLLLTSVGTSLMIGCIGVARTACFVFLSKHHFWHYETLPLIKATLLGAIVFLLAFFLPVSLPISILALTSLGMIIALTYTNCVVYNISLSQDRGKATGFNEVIQLGGYCVGALLAGIGGSSTVVGLPYLIISIVFACGTLGLIRSLRVDERDYEADEPMDQAGHTFS